MAQIVIRHSLRDLVGAEQHFMAGLKFFDDPGRRGGSGAVSETAFVYGGLNAWMLGWADVARQRMMQMTEAVDERNSYNTACSVLFAAKFHLTIREYEQAQVLAAHALELMEKHQFAIMASAARRILGVAVAQELAGAVGDALESIEQALRVDSDGRSHRPETLRIRGELRLKQRQTELAEADFREAVALAQKTGAKAWELRATMSLAGMITKHGRREEARAMLAEIYGWFTEGFDTADLKDAKALLEELNA
jgi:tetratricopeptide (TPR) repeat protein